MIKAVVIGASFGGIEALRKVLLPLPDNLHMPVFVVLHIGNNSIDTFIHYLKVHTRFIVMEGCDHCLIEPNHIYFAPPNYHLQIDDQKTMSLSVDPKVNYSRPSVDVLFETASWAFRNQLLGVLLTGSNLDGAAGLHAINKCGGTTIVENPVTAVAKTMPQAAIDLFEPDYILSLNAIPAKIAEIVTR